MFVQRCIREVQLTYRRGDRTAAGQVKRETSTCQRRSPRQAVTLAAPDGAPNRTDRPPVSELVLGEAERVQRRDLGLSVSPPPGKAQSSFGKQRSGGRVGLDAFEGGLRDVERIAPTRHDCHAGRCIRTVTTCSQCS
ncbi:MAG TPA: hypothetical protein VLC49_14685 [Solirubrobacteraceae bacterium]|nr:hypothetical protein [Solirubrobacteraceae bacterium]